MRWFSRVFCGRRRELITDSPPMPYQSPVRSPRVTDDDDDGLAGAMVPRFSAIVGALLIASGTANAAGGGIVAGTVVSLAVPGSLATVDVSLVNVFTGSIVATTRPDDKGKFSFQSVAEGQYGVEAINKTACDISRTFSVSQDSMTVVQLRLKDKTLCSEPLSFAN